MLTVGLTGGIASGKSLAAAALRELGAPVLDADGAAREVVAPGSPGLAAIRARFGPRFLQADGSLDRRRMREHVFADPAERRALEAITHPLIRDRLIAWRDAQRAPYCVLDVQILVESGLDALVDRVLVIDATPESQVRRLMARDGSAETLARRMLDAQAPRAARLARADDVVLNEGTVEVLREAAGRLHAFYLELARTGERRRSGLHLP